jgi:hypothetical protein
MSAAVARSVILGSASGAAEYGWLRFDEPTYRPEFGCTCTFARGEDETSVTFTVLDAYRDELLDFTAALSRLAPSQMLRWCGSPRTVTCGWWSLATGRRRRSPA